MKRDKIGQFRPIFSSKLAVCFLQGWTSTSILCIWWLFSKIVGWWSEPKNFIRKISKKALRIIGPSYRGVWALYSKVLGSPNHQFWDRMMLRVANKKRVGVENPNGSLTHFVLFWVVLNGKDLVQKMASSLYLYFSTFARHLCRRGNRESFTSPT